MNETKMELLGNGFFTDTSGKKMGLIINGREVLSPVYDIITPFTNANYNPKYPRSSCYIIHDNNGYGLYFYVYMGMDVIISTQFDSISYAGEIKESAYFYGKNGNTYTILSNNFDFNTNSNPLFLENSIDNIEIVERRGFKLYKDGKTGFMDYMGKLKIPITYSQISCILHDSYIADGIWKTYEGKEILDLKKQDIVFMSHQFPFVILYNTEKDLYLFYKENGVEVWNRIEETDDYIIINGSYGYLKKKGILKEFDQYQSYQEYQDQLQRDIEVGTMDYYDSDPDAQWNTD